MCQTTEQLLDDIQRLMRGVDHWREWNIAEFRRQNGHKTPVPYQAFVSPGFMLCILVPNETDRVMDLCDKSPERDTSAYWLARIDRKAVSLSRARTVLKEIRRWYSHAASDIQYMQTKLESDEAQKFTDYLAQFRRDVGFDLFSESGLVLKVAHKVLKRGRLVNEEEWRLLKEVRDDLSQSILTDQEALEISDLMDQFEGAA